MTDEYERHLDRVERKKRRDRTPTQRERAKDTVKRWANIRTDLAVSSTHPLMEIQQLHQEEGGTLGGPSGTRPSPGSTIPVRELSERDVEALQIMRHVELVSPSYYNVLAAWANGGSLDDMARDLKTSKPTIYRAYEGGLAVVQSCLLLEAFVPNYQERA